MKNNHIETDIIHLGNERNEHGSLVDPIYQSASFVFNSFQEGVDRFKGDDKGFIYGRVGNPTLKSLETKIAFLEGTEDAIATASGMAAVSHTVFGIVKSGDHMIVSDALYGSTYGLFKHVLPGLGIDVSFVDLNDEKEVESKFNANTKVIFLETPVNPHLKIVDIAKIVRIAKEHDVLTVIDNTMLSPVLQKPVDLGIDIVLHSATKYLNGHGDVIGGVIAGPAEFIENIRWVIMKDFGGTMSPHDAWLINRGLMTLTIRMKRVCETAQLVAEYLESHPKIDRVFYPGLTSHLQFSLAQEQMKGNGGVIAFEINGDIKEVEILFHSLQLIKIAISFGDAETVIQHPATMTHSSYEPEEQVEIGITQNLVRISVGLENSKDIISDLDQALRKLPEIL